jgi:4-hydroxy-4-methyl-2-oxoglutarate aldolase
MIHDPPLLTIRRHVPRPAAEQVAALRGVPTGHLVDAMGGRGCLPHEIRALFPDKADMVGVAVTCHAGPADNLALFGAIEVAERGDILVAATDRFRGTAVIGDLLLGMARNKGVAGFVTDGLVRDIPGLQAVGLPVFCAGVTANSPARNGPGHVGTPVVIGDVVVNAGDILVGDSDGVVVVPRESADRVIDALAGIRTAEQALEAKVRDGLTVPDFIRDVLSNRTDYID